MTNSFSGKAWKYGDHIDTDVIIPARYLVSSDEAVLGKYCMEDIDKDFVRNMSRGDMIVAERISGAAPPGNMPPSPSRAPGAAASSRPPSPDLLPERHQRGASHLRVPRGCRVHRDRR